MTCRVFGVHWTSRTLVEKIEALGDPSFGLCVATA
jgi:hypothetical protein